MTLPSAHLIAGMRAAAGRLASRETPLIFDEWYCAGFGNEFTRALFGRTLLGRDVVFFRTSAGEVVALDDRCAHRSFPLSQGRLVEDRIVCRYHGFCYDQLGDCVGIPSQQRVPRIGVHSYPTREIGRIVWIWMGDPSRTATRDPPTPPWMTDPGLERSVGYLTLAASYVSLHENLLDLTHIEYLHAETLGLNSPGFAAAPFEPLLDDGRIAIRRRVEPTGLPPVFATTTGLGAVRTAARVSRTDFVSPAMEQITATYFDGALPEGARQEFTVHTAHLMTPLTQTSTHYFIDHAWNWGHGDAELHQAMHDGLFAAFREDVWGLERVEASLAARSAGPTFFEFSAAADAAGLAMRRHLLKRATDEAPAHGQVLGAP